jgi:Group II intron, maturase-specific domain
VLDGLGLRPHPEKTRIAQLERGAQGFTFLGFEHRMRESWKPPGRWYLHKWPSRRAMASIPGKIRDRTDRRYARLPLQWAVEDLNRVLRGRGNYLRYGNSARKFDQIDGCVNERLELLAGAKHGLRGRNWVSRFNHEWSTQLGVSRLTGTVPGAARAPALRLVGTVRRFRRHPLRARAVGLSGRGSLCPVRQGRSLRRKGACDSAADPASRSVDHRNLVVQHHLAFFLCLADRYLDTLIGARGAGATLLRPTAGAICRSGSERPARAASAASDAQTASAGAKPSMNACGEA